MSYNFSRTTGFTYLVKKLVECEAIDSVHDITIGYPAGLIQGESDLADGKMPKEGNGLFCDLVAYFQFSSFLNQTISN